LYVKTRKITQPCVWWHDAPNLLMGEQFLQLLPLVPGACSMLCCMDTGRPVGSIPRHNHTGMPPPFLPPTLPTSPLTG
jgi:hypothetical protein